MLRNAFLLAILGGICMALAKLNDRIDLLTRTTSLHTEALQALHDLMINVDQNKSFSNKGAEASWSGSGDFS